MHRKTQPSNSVQFLQPLNDTAVRVTNQEDEVSHEQRKLAEAHWLRFSSGNDPSSPVQVTYSLGTRKVAGLKSYVPT